MHRWIVCLNGFLRKLEVVGLLDIELVKLEPAWRNNLIRVWALIELPKDMIDFLCFIHYWRTLLG
jgi:hypothetical protein